MAGEPILAHGAILKIGGGTLGSIGTPVFAGTGNNDLTVTGPFTGTWADDLYIEIDNAVSNPNTFKWSIDGGSTFEATGVNCATTPGTTLQDGLKAVFGAVTGHVAADDWTVPVTQFAAVANRTDISYKPPAKEKVDVTHHDSTDRQYIKGFGDGGEVSFSCFYHPDNATHVALKDAHDGTTAIDCQLIFKDGTIVDFEAYVLIEGWELGVANKPQTCSVKLEITGTPVYTDPA
jgi:hypothetical protein